MTIRKPLSIVIYKYFTITVVTIFFTFYSKILQVIFLLFSFLDFYLVLWQLLLLLIIIIIIIITIILLFHKICAAQQFFFKLHFNLNIKIGNK